MKPVLFNPFAAQGRSKHLKEMRMIPAQLKHADALLWKWCSETGFRKGSHPMFVTLRKYYYSCDRYLRESIDRCCFCCGEAVRRLMKHKAYGVGRCTFCPKDWGHGGTCESKGTLYYRWNHEMDCESRKKLAKKIYQKPWNDEVWSDR